MRKRIASLAPAIATRGSDQGWLDLTEIATIEVSSEEDGFPIESVFANNDPRGWRASRPGEQVIRLIFDEPTPVGRIRLRFHESRSERTQQFTLSSCAEKGVCREIVRQQWNFSPHGSTQEIEDYTVNLDSVSALEIAIQPDINRKDAVATLAEWRVG
jgi:hypothetical protein